MSIKGQTKIILTDVATGEKEEYVDNNTFTNAVSDFVNLPFFNPYSTFKTLTGDVRLKAHDDNTTDSSFFYNGIALFGDTIDTSQYYASGKTQIGYALKGVANSSSYSGMYDSSRSSSNVRAYSFTSGQCNGTIKSICLMNPIGAQITYGINGVDDKINAYIDSANKCEINVPFPNPATAVDGEMSAKRGVWSIDKSRYYEFYTIKNYENKHSAYCDIFEYNANGMDIINGDLKKIETKTLLSSTTNAYNSWAHGDVAYDEATNKIYYFMNYNSQDNTNKKDIYAFECTINNDGGLTTRTIDLKSLCPNSTYTITTMEGIQYYLTLFPHVYNGKMFITVNKYEDYSTEKTMYVVNLNNLSDKTQVNNPLRYFTDTDYPFYKIGSSVYFGQTDEESFNAKLTTCVADINAKTIKPVNLKNGVFDVDLYRAKAIPYVWCTKNNKHVGYVDVDGKYIYLNMMFLTTINNLETPITKTSDKTMEIVYTLTSE